MKTFGIILFFLLLALNTHVRGDSSQEDEQQSNANKAKEDKEKLRKSYGTVIGIDLGTTYSCVGVVKNNRVEIIANDQGNRITPSYVAFNKDGERLIGDAAKNQLTSNPENTVFDAKRLIGRQYNDESVQNDKKYWPFKLVEKDDKPHIRINVNNQEKLFAPEEISAMVLSKMKEIAEEYLGKKVTHAVVTVPAYFNDAQRQATKDAGSISGLTIIRIINEPTAAAIAYGLDKKDSEKSILVFDLGGGTFDVSILLIDNGVFEVVATNGDTHLGGEDFDNRVMEYFLGLFEKKSGMDARSDNRAVQKLRREVEKAKRTLSSEFNTRIEIDSFFDGQDFSESFTRARFEELNADLFKRTLVPVEKVLKDGHLKKSDISEIVMVGGSTRIPKVQELVRQFFDGKDLNKGINPDEAIAYGAAVQAGLLSGEEMAKELVLLDVCPLTLGIEVKGEVMSKIITRNTVIPTKKSQIFTTTHNNQNMIKVKIFEGERVMTKDNNLLGEFDLSGIASAPAGGPQIEVTFQIDANGILRVSAEDKASGSKNNIVINNNKGRLSDEQIERMIAEAEKFAEDDRKIRERIEAKSQFESYVYSLKASFDKIKSKLNAHDQETLQYAIDERINWLDASDAVSAADFQEQKKELEDIASPIMERFYENKQERKKTDDEL